MAVLIDSNVLIFSVQSDHPQHEEAINAVEFYLQSNAVLYVFLQNIAEFWNVCTRPADKSGLGLSTAETGRRLANLDPILTLLPDTSSVYRVWRNLVLQHDVKGVQVHDARLAAGMIVHGIKSILTYNPRDFKRYTQIRVVHPAEIIA